MKTIKCYQNRLFINVQKMPKHNKLFNYLEIEIIL